MPPADLWRTQTLFASGDVIAQQAVDRKGLSNHDPARTGRMAFYGGCTSQISLPRACTPLSSFS